MKYFSKLHPIAFLAAFAIGMFYVYVTQPPMKIIIKHPTPENAGKIVYKDTKNKCYKYLSEEIDCPSNTSMIMEHPTMISSN